MIHGPYNVKLHFRKYLTELLIQSQRTYCGGSSDFLPRIIPGLAPTDFSCCCGATMCNAISRQVCLAVLWVSLTESGYPCAIVPYPFATFQYDDIVKSLFPCSIEDLMQFMTMDRMEKLPVLHTSAAVRPYIYLLLLSLEISITSVQAGTVRNYVMRPQMLGKRWTRRGNVCGNIRGRNKRKS